MWEWLKAVFYSDQTVDFDIVVGCMVASALLGGAVAMVYAATHRRDESWTPSFLATLVLLAIVVATVTLVIGNNTARAFSLVGALAIVRFRTVVEDTRDTAFVMLAVIVGMAAGAGQVLLGLACLGLSGLVAAILQPRRSPRDESRWNLTVRLPLGQNPETLLQNLFDKHLGEHRLVTTTTARQGAALEMTWAVRLRSATSPAELIAELNRLEGVQNVELRRG